MTTQDNNHPELSNLEQVRVEGGNDRLKTVFNEIAARDKQEAIDSLNHEDLQFPSIFSLLDEIEKLGIFAHLTKRNQIAIEFTKEVQARMAAPPDVPHPIPTSAQIHVLHAVLRWILETGTQNVGSSVGYDNVVDVAAALLTTTFSDRTILPTMIDLIFARHEKGLIVEDLVWAFFEARDPYSLGLVAERLRSSNIQERSLASRLLCFIPGVDVDRNEGEEQYLECLKWLEENSIFLYYTGESFQMTSNPKPFKISLEAKHLGRPVSVNTGKIFGSLTREEANALDEFRNAPEELRDGLASHSTSLRRQSLQDWHTWLNGRLEEQLRSAHLGSVK